MTRSTKYIRIRIRSYNHKLLSSYTYTFIHIILLVLIFHYCYHEMIIIIINIIIIGFFTPSQQQNLTYLVIEITTQKHETNEKYVKWTELF